MKVDYQRSTMAVFCCWQLWTKQSSKEIGRLGLLRNVHRVHINLIRSKKQCDCGNWADH